MRNRKFFYKALIVLVFLLTMPSCLRVPLFDVTEDETLCVHPDQSAIVSMGGPEYEHYLFGDYMLRIYSPFCVYFLPSERFDFLPGDYYDYFVYSYCFSAGRYIAAHIFQIAPTQTGNLFQNSNTGKTENTITVDRSELYYDIHYYFLYDTESGQREIFSEKQDFDVYCATNGIEFSAIYFYSPFEGGCEKETVISDSIRIFSRGYYYSDTVRINGKDFLFGYIDRYAVSDGIIFFDMDFTKPRISPETACAGNSVVPESTKNGYVAMRMDDYTVTFYTNIKKCCPDFKSLDWISLR